MSNMKRDDSLTFFSLVVGLNRCLSIQNQNFDISAGVKVGSFSVTFKPLSLTGKS